MHCIFKIVSQFSVYKRYVSFFFLLLFINHNVKVIINIQLLSTVYLLFHMKIQTIKWNRFKIIISIFYYYTAATFDNLIPKLTKVQITQRSKIMNKKYQNEYLILFKIIYVSLNDYSKFNHWENSMKCDVEKLNLF